MQRLFTQADLMNLSSDEIIKIFKGRIIRVFQNDGEQLEGWVYNTDISYPHNHFSGFLVQLSGSQIEKSINLQFIHHVEIII